MKKSLILSAAFAVAIMASLETHAQTPTKIVVIPRDVITKVPTLQETVVTTAVTSSQVQRKVIARGNEGGGGGNLVVIKQLTAEQLKSYVHGNRPSNSLKAVTKNVFLALRDAQKVLPAPTYKKLFAQDGLDIFQAIDEAKLTLEQASCLDPHSGEERDGSADGESLRICLSSSRLTKKLYNTTGYELLIKLMVHEAGHLVGLNETEARVLEEYVQLPDVRSPDDIDNVVDDIQKMNYGIAAITEELRLKNFGPKDELCRGMLEINSHAVSLSQIERWSERNTYRIADLGQLASLGHVRANLPTTKMIAGYCFDKTIPRESVVASLSELCRAVSTDKAEGCY